MLFLFYLQILGAFLLQKIGNLAGQKLSEFRGLETVKNYRNFVGKMGVTYERPDF